MFHCSMYYVQIGAGRDLSNYSALITGKLDRACAVSTNLWELEWKPVCGYEEEKN